MTIRAGTREASSVSSCAAEMVSCRILIVCVCGKALNRIVCEDFALCVEQPDGDDRHQMRVAYLLNALDAAEFLPADAPGHIEKLQRDKRPAGRSSAPHFPVLSTAKFFLNAVTGNWLIAGTDHGGGERGGGRGER